MTSEWMKVMLEEISRKKTEAEQARLEEQGRREEQERREEKRRGEEQRSGEARRPRDEASLAPRSGTDRARG